MAAMKAVKWLVVLLVVYVAIVAGFESLIGFLQPQGGSTLVIVTRDSAGDTRERVVSRLETDGNLYVAANHWPRAWFRRALATPDVEVILDGARGPYRAVRVEGSEYDRVASEHALGIVFRILTGFPPRYFLRLDPR